MARLGIVGNLTVDLVDGRRPRAGGGPIHCARALRALQAPAVVVTKSAERDRPTVLPPLLALGVPVTWRPSESTAVFRIAYTGDDRVMSIDALGPTWTPEEARGWVADALGRAEWVHVAGLARSEFPAETLAALARGRRISLDAQALVRPAATGPLVADGEFDEALLDHISVLKVSREELEALGREPGELGVPEVLITHGSRGSEVWARGVLEPVPARPVTGRDPTGAGDAFIASYLVARYSGLPPVPAARRATAVVAAVLSGRAV